MFISPELNPAMSDTPQVCQRPTRVERAVTPRVVAVSIALAVLFGRVMPVIDYKLDNTYLGSTHLPAAAIGALLFILLLINPLLHVLPGRLAFTRNETLTIYISCLFSSLVPGRGGENFFIPNVLAPFYYATRENQWLGWLGPYLKPWFSPALTANGAYNQSVVKGWYEGSSSVPWGSWFVPLAAWTLIILALYAMQACLGVILRAQWAENEALTFPLLRLPQEMTQDMNTPNRQGSASFFCNVVMWLGFGVAASIQLLNGLNLYFSEIPRFPLEISTDRMLTESPWNQVGHLTLKVWPVAIGISYLLSSEVAFSLWFFYLFHKSQYLAAFALGFPPAAGPNPIWGQGFAKSFISYQQMGAYVAYVALLVWTGRTHFRHVLNRAFGRAPATKNETYEALSYPVAFWGFLLSFLYIIGWTVAAGVRLDIAFVLWTGYVILILGLTRVVTEGGLLMVHVGWAPIGPVAHLTGGWITASSGIPAAFISNVFMLEMRSILLPSYLHSFKLARDHGIAAKPLFGLIAVVTMISFGTGVYTILQMGYQDGALNLTPWWSRGAGAQGAARFALEFVNGFQDNFLANWCWFGTGAALTWLMVFLRSQFAWFPFHPIGYLMMAPFAISQLWLSVFVAWLAKSLVMRFGGATIYPKTVPFFLGLALGDFAMMIFWVIIDGWQGHTGHFLVPH
jgi:hypothetical protein